MITVNVPYPTGFYAKGMDGRIDDPTAGWKAWACKGRKPMAVQHAAEARSARTLNRHANIFAIDPRGRSVRAFSLQSAVRNRYDHASNADLR
jgi:hypothetical protein